MTAAEQTAAFCSALLDDLSERAGLTSTVWVVHESGVKSTRWLNADPEIVAEAAIEADAEPGANVYLSMAFASVRLGERKRLSNDLVSGITAVWCEIDLADPAAHAAQNLPATVEQAMRVLCATGLRPSVVTHSGHGLHALWLLDEPWVFADADNEALERTHARELLRDWRGTIAVHAHTQGAYKLDAVHDLARVLRVPGTTNRKRHESTGDPLPETDVVLLECDTNRRYSPDDLRAAMVDRAHLAAHTTIRAQGLSSVDNVNQVAIWTLCQSYAPTYEPEWLMDAMANMPGLREAWAGRRGGDSETDAAIARALANEGADEEMAIEAIFCYRLRHGRKLDKVDPSRRTDYIESTIDFTFSGARQQRELVAAAEQASADAVAAQRAEASRPRPVVDHRALDPPDGTGPRVADVAAHVLAQTTDVIVPDSEIGSPAVPPLPPTGGSPDPDDPDDPDDDIPDDDVPVMASAIPGAPTPVAPRDPVARLREAEPPGADGTGPSLLPPPNPWGERGESQARELGALSDRLFGPQPGVPQVWKLFQRGRGASSQRRIQLRLPDDHQYLGRPPEGFRRGMPLHSGWWPTATFDGLGGWLKVIRNDLRLVPLNVDAREFNARFADSLVAFWEPDDSAGSVGSVISSALIQYLVACPLTPELSESMSTGTPRIVQSQPRWDPSTPFEVFVRWSEVCRFVRTHYAVNVTPPVAADMEEIAGVEHARTTEQDGQWRKLDPEYFSPAQWKVALDAGRLAEEGRQDRRFRVVRGGQS